MGKKLGTVALFVGAFVLLLSVLSRYYMYDRLAVAPANTQTTSISATAPGDDAEYLDVAAGVKIVNGPLKSTRVVTGDVKASEQASKKFGRNIAVWNTYNCTSPPSFDCGGDGVPLSAGAAVVAFDANTGATVDWSGAKIENGDETIQPANFKGLFFKFPFDTQKKTYPFWDGTLRKPMPAVYQGETTIEGLKVYKFEQTIEPAKTGTIDVPGTLVNSDEETVTADRIYSAVRTFNVEPVTGVVILGGETQDSYLEVDGVREATTTAATLEFTEQNTKDTVEEYKPKVQLLTIVKTTLPIGGSIVGVLLILGGLVLHRRSDSKHSATA